MAGEFDGAVEGAETAGDFLEGGGADAADFTAGGGDGVDLGLGWGLGPGEGVEDGFGGVAETLGEFGTFGCEPEPMGGGLENAEGIIVAQCEARERIPGPNFGRDEYENGAFRDT